MSSIRQPVDMYTLVAPLQDLQFAPLRICTGILLHTVSAVAVMSRCDSCFGLRNATLYQD